MWNHRVIKHKQHPSRTGTEYWYGIHEVYYDEDGNPSLYTERPVGVLTEDWGEGEEYCMENLKETLNWMQDCLSQPILSEEDFS